MRSGGTVADALHGPHRSDKATVEITSPYSGVLRSPCGEVGTIAQVGGVLCEIETEGEAGGAAEVVSVHALSRRRRPQLTGDSLVFLG